MLHRIAVEAAGSNKRTVEVASVTREPAVAANDIARNVEPVPQMAEETNATKKNNAQTASERQAMAQNVADAKVS